METRFDLPQIGFQQDSAVPGLAVSAAHNNCTPKFCQQANIDSTKVKQMHMNTHPDQPHCPHLSFDMSRVDVAIDQGQPTAWLCGEANRDDNQVQLARPGDKYVAISHVWSDGTGVGVSETWVDSGLRTRMVNSCLWQFWEDMINYDRVDAIWWDTVCVPEGKEQRAKALKVLHKNYAKAAYTIVHDGQLAQMQYTDAETACVALVLSNWFSRGWTALELQVSRKVKVLFRQGDDIVPVDLDEEILASSPATSSPAHWMATSWIKRLREPMNDVGDIIHTLNSRSTSWTRDRTIIAALLADVPSCDFLADEGQISKDILKYLGKIPSLCLFHGEATMANKGPWSWCPSTIFHMPAASPIDVESRGMSDFLSLLDITETGEISGQWRCLELREKDYSKVQLFGRDPSSRIKVRLALQQDGGQHYLLLRPVASVKKEEPALLVEWFGGEEDHHGEPTLQCHYIGTVWVTRDFNESAWRYCKINMGCSPKSEEPEGSENFQFSVVSSDHPKDSEPDEESLGEEPEHWVKRDPESWVGDAPVTWWEIIENDRTRVRATRYLLELSNKSQLDPELIETLRSQAHNYIEPIPDTEAQVNTHGIINGLWSLGDYYLRGLWRDLQKAEDAYKIAYDLSQTLLGADSPTLPNSGHSVPPYASAMLAYQRGLVSMLRGEFTNAQVSFRKAVDSSKRRTASQKSPKPREVRHLGDQKDRSSMPEDSEGWYFAKRSALGALILMSFNHRDQDIADDINPPLPAEYFVDSLRKAERARLESGVGRLVINYSLGVEADQPDLKPSEGIEVTKTLKQALRKFDVLFRKKHILCCITALCLGIALRISTYAPEISNTWRISLSEEADEQFRRVWEDLEVLLPKFIEDDSGQVMKVEQWRLKDLVLANLRRLHEEYKQFSEAKDVHTKLLPFITEDSSQHITEPLPSRHFLDPVGRQLRNEDDDEINDMNFDDGERGDDGGEDELTE
ncbi:hypothetical protein SGCOL_000161 [Colletotrichum sp. CLE4]